MCLDGGLVGAREGLDGGLVGTRLDIDGARVGGGRVGPGGTGIKGAQVGLGGLEGPVGVGP